MRKLLGLWPYVCRRCGKCSWLPLRDGPKRRAAPRESGSPPPSPVDCETRRHNAEAAVVIRAETEHQLTNILLALSRAVEAEQRVDMPQRPNSASARR
jgi:hypothetical protein